MHDSRGMIHANLGQAMRARGLDAIVATSPENFAYLSGFVVPSQPLMRWRHAAYVLTASGQSAVLVVDMEHSTVSSHLPGCPVRAWGEFTDDPMAVLADVLGEAGLSASQIGLELDFLPAGDFARLSGALPKAQLVAAQDVFARCRQIKTPGELNLMRRLARIADQSIAAAFAASRVGTSEMDMAGVLTSHVYKLGADDFKLMIVATGERSVFPNVGPTERTLKPGDVCRVEIFAMQDGYHAGVCRTAYVDHPPAHAEQIWQVLDDCKHIVLDMMKPGVSSKSVYDAFTQRLRVLNLPPIKFIGHGIGLHLHEKPYLGMYSDVPLEEGMVLGVEPLIYDTGYGFGMQNKDIVAVTPAGAELLSDVTDTTTLIEIPAS